MGEEVGKRTMGICIMRLMRMCFMKKRDVQKSKGSDMLMLLTDRWQLWRNLRLSGIRLFYSFHYSFFMVSQFYVKNHVRPCSTVDWGWIFYLRVFPLPDWLLFKGCLRWMCEVWLPVLYSDVGCSLLGNNTLSPRSFRWPSDTNSLSIIYS